MKLQYIVLCTLLLLCACRAPQPEEEPKPVVNVKTAVAEEADIQLSVTGPATVFPREQANVAGRITSPIRELKAGKGDSVTSGQVLAQLDNRDLLAQQREAVAAVTDAEATLNKLVSGTVPGDIERAKGQVATAQAALDQAQKFYDRRKQLFDQGAIPNRDLVVSETELAQAKTSYTVAQRSLALLEGQSAEHDTQIARSRVEQAQARLALIDAQLAYSTITSPFAGTIIEQFVFAGDMAKPDSPIFTIADLSTAVARAQVPESEARKVRSGSRCTLRPSDQPDATFAGKVTSINSAVDSARRTVEVWCEIPNGNRQLRAGAFGSVQIITGSLAKAIVVPREAVQFEEGSPRGVVMIVGSDRKAHKQDVETGPADAGRVSIQKGLNKGDTVIVEGGYGIADGTDVTVAETPNK